MQHQNQQTFIHVTHFSMKRQSMVPWTKGMFHLHSTIIHTPQTEDVQQGHQRGRYPELKHIGWTHRNAHGIHNEHHLEQNPKKIQDDQTKLESKCRFEKYTERKRGGYLYGSMFFVDDLQITSILFASSKIPYHECLAIHVTVSNWAQWNGYGKSLIFRAFWMFTIPLESSWKVRDKIGAGILIVWS